MTKYKTVDFDCNFCPQDQKKKLATYYENKKSTIVYPVKRLEESMQKVGGKCKN